MGSRANNECQAYAYIYIYIYVFIYTYLYMYHTCGKDQSAALWYITDIALQSVVYCDIPRLAVVVSIYGVTSHIPRNLIPKP